MIKDGAFGFINITSRKNFSSFYHFFDNEENNYYNSSAHA